MKPQYIEINKYGNKRYYSDREMTVLHCEDGPAIEWLGSCWWYLNGELISEAEHVRRTTKEIVLTMRDIAAKFGVSVEQLKITK